MHPAQSKNPAFLAYVESFCKRKPGFLAYSEFISFVRKIKARGYAHKNTVE
jgi:hypothetical protein